MLLCITNYFKKPSEDLRRREAQEEEEEEERMVSMLSLCTTEASSQVCTSSCFPTPFLSIGLPANPNSNSATTTGAARSNFSRATASSVFPDTHFTNHESLPSLPDAFNSFTAAFPKYADTLLSDRIRDTEYQNLSTHLCLDYAGIGLFSHEQMQESSSSTASSSSSPTPLQPPFFDISYKSASLNSEIRYGNQETALESAIKKRIMSFLHISSDDYTMVCTANRTAAFKLLAETYPFPSNKRLLTVYDHESEAVSAMSASASKRGAKVMSASFSWSSLRIQSSKLRKMVITRNKNRRGLFVFPLQSWMTGARYPYLWMSIAQENGWHVVLDATALGPKDMDTLGLSLIQPDFIVCSFYKVFGGNPSGFAGIFIKRSGTAVLESSTIARSIGVVSIVPSRRLSQLTDDFSGTDSEAPQNAEITEAMREPSSEIMELSSGGSNERLEIECRGLDHADSLGLVLISSRLRYITNWLVIALMRLRHPHSENGHSLVKIYGPRVKFDRAPALAFNVFDWKGEKVEPALVQKLADRSNISLCCGFLHSIWFSDRYEEQKDQFLERRRSESTVDSKRREIGDVGIHVVSASIGFLANFEDAYRLWGFVAKFLDADFVEKERWRYVALNQKVIEV